MQKLIFLLLTLFAGSLLARESLIEAKLSSSLNSWELNQIKSFISEAEKSLPPLVRQTLLKSAPIKLEFTDISNAKTDISIIALACRGADRKAYDELGPGEFGFAHHKMLFVRDHPYVELDQILYSEILKGPKNSFQYNCGHKTGYKLALATLLHELIHIYDNQLKISKDRQFLHLMTFTSFGFLHSQKNRLNFRSVDPYEMVSPKEAFALNFEYFILDSEYRCRRPALYEFFAEKLSYRPFMAKSCSLNTSVVVQGVEKRLMSLNFKDLYRVDYLLADAGKELSSGFGHSMLRLIFCAPGQAKSLDCVNNILNHVVISFRANVVNNRDNEEKKVKSNYLWSQMKAAWGRLEFALKGVGLAPNYPSKMFLLSVPYVVSEYNNYDYRNLKSIPIKLTEIEKRDLIYRVLEINWGYEGSYNFITNNCRTETEDLLKAVVRNAQIEKVNTFTPIGLRDSLYKNNLVLQDDGNKEIIHPSLKPSIIMAITKLREIITKEKWQFGDLPIAHFLIKEDFSKVDTMKKYIAEFSADQRRSFVLLIKNRYENEKSYRMFLAGLLIIENASKKFQDMDLLVYESGIHGLLWTDHEELQEFIEPVEYETLNKRMAQEKVKGSYARDQEAPLKKGYGIPTHEDWDKANINFTGPEDVLLQNQIAKIAEDLINEDRVNLSTSSETIRLIMDLLFERR